MGRDSRKNGWAGGWLAPCVMLCLAGTVACGGDGPTVPSPDAGFKDQGPSQTSADSGVMVRPSSKRDAGEATNPQTDAGMLPPPQPPPPEPPQPPQPPEPPPPQPPPPEPPPSQPPEGSDAGVDAGTPGGSAPEPSSAVTFHRHTVAPDLKGVAWTAVADFDGDGRLDILASAFGQLGFSIPNGEVQLFTQGSDLSQWTGQVLVSSTENVKFPNLATIADLDADGDLDFVLPAGFLVCAAIPIVGGPCGGLLWFENQGQAFVRHDIIAPGAELFYHHAAIVDFDGDGIEDLVTVGESKGPLFGGGDKAVSEWFKGTSGPERFEAMPREIGAGLGSMPRVRDIDGDGDLDVAGAEFFVAGESFAWLERTAQPSEAAPNGSFVRHVIDATSGPAIMMSFVENLYGDGVLRAIGTNHTNTAKNPPDPQGEGVFVLTPGSDPKQGWHKEMISAGIQSVAGSRFAPMAAPGIFDTGDVDGDGDLDIVVSGDGDPHVYWLEQTNRGQWAQHILEDNLPQAGGLRVIDLDGDGRNEIVVAGYTQNVVYVYARTEQAPR